LIVLNVLEEARNSNYMFWKIFWYFIIFCSPHVWFMWELGL